MTAPINEEAVETAHICTVFNEQRTATNISENKEPGTQEKTKISAFSSKNKSPQK